MSEEVKDVVLMGEIAPTTMDMATDGVVEYRLKCIENMLNLKDEVLKLCIKRAKPTDIIDMGGNPYFTEAFCEQILSRLGNGSVQITAKDFEKYDDNNYSYTVTIHVDLPGLGSADGIGMATSTDKFLGVTRNRGLDKVSRHSLLQHARTRAVGKALRGLLGLNNYSWSELADLGFKKSGARSANIRTQSTGKAKNTASGATKSKLCAFVNDGTFDWSDITKVCNDLGLKGKALEMPEKDLKELVEELDKRAEELSK